MKLARLLASLMIFGGLAFGDEKNVIQSPPPEKQDQAPLWSTELISDYTLGSKISKSGELWLSGSLSLPDRSSSQCPFIRQILPSIRN